MVAPPITSRGRQASAEDGDSPPTLLKSRVWKISTEDEEELQLSPFHAEANSRDSVRQASFTLHWSDGLWLVYLLLFLLPYLSSLENVHGGN